MNLNPFARRTRIRTGTLVLMRHAESEWNAKGVWSGITDVELSPKGRADCAVMMQALDDLDLRFAAAVYTDQKRTKQTLDGIAAAQALAAAEFVLEPGFNERNYGEYTGMNKWKVQEQLGEAAFQALRRGWDVPFTNGETLKAVYERVVPAYQRTVLPRLQAGENVLIVAHGNSLRALMKYLDDIPDSEIADLEMLMNQLVVYHIDPTTGRQGTKEVRDMSVAVESHF